MIVDYAWQRPSLTWLKDHGVHAVGRYIGQDTTGKNMIRAEVEKLNRAGIYVWTIFEFAAAQATGGARQADIDGELALQQTALLGQPDSAPVYFSVDFDLPDYAPNSTNAREKLGPVGDYFARLQRYFPLHRIGGYGSYYLVNRLREAKLAEWYYQTVAWSGGQVAHFNNIYQPGEKINGIDIDEEMGVLGEWTSKFLTSHTPTATVKVQERGHIEDLTLHLGETVSLATVDLQLLHVS